MLLGKTLKYRHASSWRIQGGSSPDTYTSKLESISESENEKRDSESLNFSYSQDHVTEVPTNM